MTGERFGRLTVLSRCDKDEMKYSHKCKCDCGRIINVRTDSLKSGNTKSCGCLQRELATDRFLKHGMYKTPEYHAWQSMFQRCENTKHPCYKDYGGRGISVCEEWGSFDTFLLDMGMKPSSDYSLDRIDNNQGYNKDNCRWATRSQQNSNTRSSRLLTHCGKTMTLSQWSSERGIHPETLRKRLRNKWSIEQALETPVKKIAAGEL